MGNMAADASGPRERATQTESMGFVARFPQLKSLTSHFLAGEAWSSPDLLPHLWRGGHGEPLPRVTYLQSLRNSFRNV